MHSKNTPWRYPLAATLLLLSPFDLLASLGMDFYLPAVPGMAAALGTGPALIQLTLTAYLVLIGAGQLVFGPLSDRVGRRPVLLGGGLAYLAASFGLAMVSSPEPFLGLRLVQAAGASACLVATFATVRDVYAGRDEGSVIYGMLGALLAVVPAAGPLLGALVETWLGWRAIFVALGSGMALALAAAWRFWPETRQRREAQVRWPQLLLPVRRLHFWLYTLGYSAGMGAFFVFFSTAPWLLMERLGLSQLRFSLVFATVAVAMMAAARAMSALAPRWGTRRVLRLGMGLLAAAGLLLAAGELLAPLCVLSFIAPMWLAGAGIAATVAVAPNGALRGFDAIAGTATALYFCLGGLMLGGAGTLVIAVLPHATRWPIAAFCVVVPAVVMCLSLFEADQGREGEGARSVPH